jgi:uncharacterized membrane protein
MAHVQIKEHFEAPIDRVFELSTDFKRYPEWNVSYPEVREVTGPIAVGTKIHAVTKVLGRSLEGWTEIVEVEPPRYLKTKGTSLQGGYLNVEYRLTPAGTGTDFAVEIEYELPAGILGQVFDHLFVERTIERDLRHSIENFKALVEARQPVLV